MPDFNDPVNKPPAMPPPLVPPAPPAMPSPPFRAHESRRCYICGEVGDAKGFTPHQGAGPLKHILGLVPTCHSCDRILFTDSKLLQQLEHARHTGAPPFLVKALCARLSVPMPTTRPGFAHAAERLRSMGFLGSSNYATPDALK